MDSTDLAFQGSRFLNVNESSALPSANLAVLLFGRGARPLYLKVFFFQVRELQTRLQSVQATGPSSPGRLTSASRPVNPSTGELSTSSSSNDIPIAKVSSRGRQGHLLLSGCPSLRGAGPLCRHAVSSAGPQGLPGVPHRPPVLDLQGEITH